VCGDFAIALAGGAEALIELLQEVLDLEVGGCGLGLVVAKKRKGDTDDGEPFAAGGVVDANDVLGEAVRIDEGGDGDCFLSLFVAANEADGLEGEEVDLLRVVKSELDDAANLLVVDAIDNDGDENDVDAGLVKIVDGLEFYVKSVANLAVRVGDIADAVELKI